MLDPHGKCIIIENEINNNFMEGIYPEKSDNGLISRQTNLNNGAAPQKLKIFRTAPLYLCIIILDQTIYLLYLSIISIIFILQAGGS